MSYVLPHFGCRFPSQVYGVGCFKHSVCLSLGRIALTIRPRVSDPQWDLTLAKAEEMELSSVESPCELKQPEPSPFSSKRTMYETEEVRAFPWLVHDSYTSGIGHLLFNID